MEQETHEIKSQYKNVATRTRYMSKYKKKQANDEDNTTIKKRGPPLRIKEQRE